MDKNRLIIEKTKEYIKEITMGESTGHDWWHIYRVWKNAIRIARDEECNLFVVELAALLHDIADWKFNNGDETAGARAAEEWLMNFDLDKNTIKQVTDIILHISFKGANLKNEISSIEGQIVQDADRIDAIGAIGIARTFAYGGSKGREMYNPEIAPVLHRTFEEYKASKGPTINHFYEKLLLLSDKMNTRTGKKIAKERDLFMREYLKHFYEEFNGENYEINASNQ